MLLEAFIFNIHRSCTPARVRYTMKGTRKIRVPLRVPLSCTLQRNRRTPETPCSKGSGGSCTLAIRFEEPTSLAGRTGRKIQRPTVRMIRTVHIDCQICLSIKNLAIPVSPSLSVQTIIYCRLFKRYHHASFPSQSSLSASHSTPEAC